MVLKQQLQVNNYAASLGDPAITNLDWYNWQVIDFSANTFHDSTKYRGSL